jgi:hypothetical protein
MAEVTPAPLRPVKQAPPISQFFNPCAHTFIFSEATTSDAFAAALGPAIPAKPKVMIRKKRPDEISPVGIAKPSSMTATTSRTAVSLKLKVHK